MEGSERIQQAHTQAMSEINAKIAHWQKMKGEYSSLSETLDTLPDKRTYDVTVPFGPFAFKPGKLVHTNELLVHLGDSWFAEVTCKGGKKIVSHRLEKVNKNIEDLNKTLGNVENKSEFLDTVATTAEGEQGIEIKEDAPSDYVHPRYRKRVSRVNEAQSAAKGGDSAEEAKVAVSSVVECPPLFEKPMKDEVVEHTQEDVGSAFAGGDNNLTKQQAFDEAAFMKRLDELEAMEEQEFEDALSENNSEDSGIDLANSLKNDFTLPPNEEVKQDESFAATLNSRLCSIKEAEECDSDDEYHQAKDDQPPLDSSHGPMRIVFKHSKNKSTFLLIPKTDDDRVIHPGDIGREKTVLKSILKPPSRHNSVSEPEDQLSASYGSTSYGSTGYGSSTSPCSSDEISDHFSELNMNNPASHNRHVSFKTPISDSVVEKSKRNGNTNGHKKKSKKKRMSKFKASRTR